jgi:hypothetical protein
MAVDSRHQQAQLSGLPYAADPLRYGAQVSQPQFNNPWANAQNGASPVYPSSQAGSSSMEAPVQMQRQTSMTLPPYNALPITTTALASGSSMLTPAPYGHPSAMQPSQEIRYPQFSAAPSSSYPAQAPAFSLDHGYGYASDAVRRPSHQHP